MENQTPEQKVLAHLSKGGVHLVKKEGAIAYMPTLYTQLLAAQAEFPKIKKDATNPFFKNKYASLDGILETVLPIMHKHGLFIIQSPINDGERVGVETVIHHSKTEANISGRFTVILAKNDPQGAGSAITYCRRYALTAMLGLNVEEDDDGNTASNQIAPRPAQSQVAQPGPGGVQPAPMIRR